MADVGALSRFELHRVLTRGGAVAALLIFLGLTVVGHWEQWTGDVARGPSELLTFAYALALIALMCFGVAQDRARAFDEYLIVNQVSWRAYIASKIGAMTVALAIGATAAAVVEGAAAGMNGADIGWHATAFFFAGLLLLPWALLVEASIDTSIPAAPVLLVYGIVVFVGYLALGTRAPIDETGLGYLAAGDWRTLGPLITRATLVMVLGSLGSVLLPALRLRRY